MTRLVWDQNVPRQYETGIDRGVLYLSEESSVVWNGLISVDESFVGGELKSYYLDGVLYNTVVGNKDFQAKVTAFTYPKEFLVCMGDVLVRYGLYLTHQPRIRFGLSYRTLVGPNDYKIHIIYNALASILQQDRVTITEQVNPSRFEWQIDAVPTACGPYHPTAHIVLDSRLIDPEILLFIETILYGSESQSPYLLTQCDLLNILFPGTTG